MRTTLRLLLLFTVVAIAAAVWLSPLRTHLTREEIRATVESVRTTPYAPILLIVMYAAGCVFAVPASIFIVAAGAIWGWLLGGTIALAGGMLGAAASFFTGRYFGAALGDHPGRSRRLLDTHLRDRGFRTLLIVRLLPVLPFAALNYGAGAMRVHPGVFLLSTFLGLIPSNYVFAWSADEIFNGSLSGRDVLLRLLTVAALCISAIVLTSLATRAFQKRIERM